MAILLVHLDKKLRISSETLDDTNEKIKSLEDSAAIFRYPKNPVNVRDPSHYYVVMISDLGH